MPLYVNEPTSNPTQVPPDAASNGRDSGERSSLQRVLLVTDRARERHVLMSALETLPVATAFASSRYDALRLARTLRPDVIVVDAELRGTEGWAICEELLGRDDVATDSWQPSFILLHGQRGDTLERAKALGMDQLLRWPFAVDEARSLLEVHLSEPGYGSGGYRVDVAWAEGDSPEEERADGGTETETSADEVDNGDREDPDDREAETAFRDSPPLDVDSDGEEPVDETAAQAEEPHAEQPGDARAAISLLEPPSEDDAESGASDAVSTDASEAGSLALFPGVQPLASSPPPIANLFPRPDDAASGPDEESESGPAPAPVENLDSGERFPAHDAVGEAAASASADASESGAETPEFVDVVLDGESDASESTAEDESVQTVDPSPGEGAADGDGEPRTESDPVESVVEETEPLVDSVPVDAPASHSDSSVADGPAEEPPQRSARLEDTKDAAPSRADSDTADAASEGELAAASGEAGSEGGDESAPPEERAEEANPADQESTDSRRSAELEESAEAEASETVDAAVDPEPESSILVEEDLGEEIFVASAPRKTRDRVDLGTLPSAAPRPALAPTLADLFNADGVSQVLLLERGGGVVFTSSKTPQLSMSQLAQHSLELFACADLVLGATDTGREGATDALVAEGADGSVLLQSVDDHFLVVCVEKSAGLGQVRFLLRRILDPLRDVLAEE